MSQMSRREAASILGVWEDAGEKDVKLAYKKLAIRWHPGKFVHDYKFLSNRWN